MFDFLYSALGWLMEQIYNLVNDYGLAIILFTVLTKILLFPLTLKQQKSSAMMQQIKPKLDEIQQKYANNREKLSEETMKLYQEYGISPTGGCLPLIIQLPIIYALYQIIEKPYTYILGWSAEKFKSYGIVLDKANSRREIQLVKEAIEKGTDIAEKINFEFLGLAHLDLSQTPDLKHPSILWAIPIVAATLTFLQSKFMYIGLSKEETDMRKGKKSAQNSRPPRPGEKKDDMSAMTGSMTYMMPVMTLVFTFSLPAGIGLYWISGSLIQIILTYVSNRFIIPKMKTKTKVTADNDTVRTKMRQNTHKQQTVKKGGNSDDIEEIRKKLREKRKNS